MDLHAHRVRFEITATDDKHGVDFPFLSIGGLGLDGMLGNRARYRIEARSFVLRRSTTADKLDVNAVAPVFPELKNEILLRPELGKWARLFLGAEADAAAVVDEVRNC